MPLCQSRFCSGLSLSVCRLRARAGRGLRGMLLVLLLMGVGCGGGFEWPGRRGGWNLRCVCVFVGFGLDCVRGVFLGILEGGLTLGAD